MQGNCRDCGGKGFRVPVGSDYAEHKDCDVKEQVLITEAHLQREKPRRWEKRLIKLSLTRNLLVRR